MPDNALPVWAVSLGCPKNRVDTERFLGSLGLPIRLTPHIGKSRLAFINTCAFIEPAARESIQAILALVKKIKSLKKPPFVVVAGCLPGRYPQNELRKELPEIDLWLSPAAFDSWPQQVLQAMRLPLNPHKDRLIPPGASYAWLKISEGCNHRCNFCTIPNFRGAYVSEPAEVILDEAKRLVKAGIKELVLVGQDISLWGKCGVKQRRASSAYPTNLPELVAEISTLPGLSWLRLLYLYPSTIDVELLRLLGSRKRPLLPYLDVPFQHSEKRILSAMGRPFAVDPRDIIEKIRSYVPDIALRSTLIVGYPGETNSDFENLCKFVSEGHFANLGVFAYQQEDGTVAAKSPNQIPEAIKMERKKILMEIQAENSRAFLEKFVGQKMSVLVDKSAEDEWPGLYQGRVWFQAPEIDGITYISGPDLTVNEIRDAVIHESKTYDLVALA